MRGAGLGGRPQSCGPTRLIGARTRGSIRSRGHLKCSASGVNVSDLPLPEGSLGLPLLGESLELLFSGDTFGSSRRERYGDVYKTNILGAPTVLVYGEEPVRAVLAAEDRLVASDWPQVTSVLVGPDSLNLLSGPRHGAVKRALSDAFSERAVRRHVPRIAQTVQGYVERWAAGPQPTPGFAACQELSQAVFDVAVLGGDGGQARAAQLQQLMASLAAGFQTPPLELPFTDYGKAVAARNAFGQLAQQSISQCRAAAASAAGPPPDCAVADLLAAASTAAASASSPPLPDSLLVDNLAAAFFGNASTGPSLAKLLQHLSAGEGGGGAVMAQLRAEQQAVLARHGADLTAEALDDMPYGAAVAREALRITPAVPAVFRVALVDFELQGRRIPKGWRVWCHLGDSVLNYNRDTFAPERWLQPSPQPAAAASAAAPAGGGGGGGGCPAHAHAGASAGARPEYSLPFGSGVRTCLGRHLVFSELLVLLAVLARGYAWEAVTPGERWRVVPAPAPASGLLLNLRRL